MNAFVLQDSYFDPESCRLSSYFSRLFIMIGQESVQYGILDTEKNTFVALADYRLPAGEPKSPGYFQDQLGRLIEEEEHLLKKHPSIVVGVTTPVHTLVPLSLFDSGRMTKYLELNYRLTDDYRPGSDLVSEIDAYNVYGLLPGLQDIIHQHFSEAAVFHRSSAFLKAVYQFPQAHDNSPALFLNISEKYIEVARFENSTAAYINTFPYQTKEDVLYYVLYALGQLKLRPDTVRLTISGMIDEGSELYRLLGSYFQSMAFAGPIASLNYSPIIVQAPIHRYFDLFALALCGS